MFHCFSCGADGTVLDLVAAMEQCGLREAAMKLAGGLCRSLTPASSGPRRGKSNWLRTKERTLRRLVSFCGASTTGIPICMPAASMQETAAEFGVGFYGGPGLLSGRLVFPIHDHRGELVAYCGRSLDGAEPRYRFPAGFPKSRVVFNLHRAAATQEPAVIVVGGFFDCLQVHQAGFRSVVALMRAALYERQQELLAERFGQVVLMLDGDQTGRRASAASAARLARHCSVRIIELATDVQPDQLSAAIMQQLVTCEQKGGEKSQLIV